MLFLCSYDVLVRAAGILAAASDTENVLIYLLSLLHVMIFKYMYSIYIYTI